MEQQRTNLRKVRRGVVAPCVLIPLMLAGCAETPAHVVNADRADTYAVSYDGDETARVVVREGDSLSRVAARCDTTVETLVQLNDFADNWSIYPGEVLRIPPRHCEQWASIPKPEPRPYHLARADDAPYAEHRSEHTDSTHKDDWSANAWWSWWTGKSAEPQASNSRFVWPVRGTIIEGFGAGRHGERNDGINIATDDGAPIHAAASGVVTYTGNELKGYGNLVLIRHPDGYVTAYAHAGSIRVARGDHVERGEVIATVGGTGDVDRPQLHFEIRRGVQAVDPQRYLVDRAS